MKIPPKPKKIKKDLILHGDLRSDYYYWLRDDKRKNKEILNYLNRENIFTNFWFKKNKVNSKKIFNLIDTNISQLHLFFKNIKNTIEFLKKQKG